MRSRFFFVVFFAAVVLASCSRCTLDGFSFSSSIRIMSYNVENLFDDRDNGTEYSEYDPGNGTWDTSLYHAKLRNTAEAIKACGRGGPDICLLQEVENDRVVTDLLEGYLNVLKYRYTITAPKGDAATTIALLSRYNPQYVLVHMIDPGDKVSLRPILEACFDVRGNGIVLFNNHWKSKYGGAAETESYRRAAAGFIRERVAEIRNERPDLCIVVAGDLNERVDEYAAVDGEYETALALASDGSGGMLQLTGSWAEAENDPELFFSPWLESTLKGSYAYAGVWEKIDHFLVGCSPEDDGLVYEEFEVIDESFLLNNDGFPRRWSVSRADGYSDHLPILLTLGL